MHAQRDGAQKDVRTSILNAAVKLFGERGYHATSLQDIIEAASCSKGAFYHYFESKEDLVRIIHDTYLDHLLAHAERVTVEPGLPLEKLASIFRHQLESLSTYRDYMAVFNQESRFLTQKKFALVQAKRDRYVSLIQALVREAIRRGDLREDLDPTIFTFALLGTFNWAFRWFRPGKPKTAEEMAAILFDIVIEGGRRRQDGRAGIGRQPRG